MIKSLKIKSKFLKLTYYGNLKGGMLKTTEKYWTCS